MKPEQHLTIDSIELRIQDIKDLTVSVLSEKDEEFVNNLVQNLVDMFDKILDQKLNYAQFGELILCFGSLSEYTRKHLEYINFTEKMQRQILNYIRALAHCDKLDLATIALSIKGLENLILYRKFNRSIQAKVISNLSDIINNIYTIKSRATHNQFAESLQQVLINLYDLHHALGFLSRIANFNLTYFYQETIESLQHKKSVAAFDCWKQLTKLMSEDYFIPDSLLTQQLVKTLKSVTAHKKMNLERGQILFGMIRLLVEKNFVDELPRTINDFIQEKIMAMLNFYLSPEREKEITDLLIVLNTHISFNKEHVNEERAKFSESLIKYISKDPNGSNISALINQKLQPIYNNKNTTIPSTSYPIAPVPTQFLTPTFVPYPVYLPILPIPPVVYSQSNDNNNNNNNNNYIPSSYKEQNMFNVKKSGENKTTKESKQDSNYSVESTSPTLK